MFPYCSFFLCIARTCEGVMANKLPIISAYFKPIIDLRLERRQVGGGPREKLKKISGSNIDL